jgi:hypothetical protein
MVKRGAGCNGETPIWLKKFHFNRLKKGFYDKEQEVAEYSK